jgi:hypothetical protein
LASSDLRGEGLALPIRKLSDGAVSWEDTFADMRRVIANLSDPADTAMSGRFRRDNRDTLRQMRRTNPDAGSTVEYRLPDRDCQLRESDG